MFFIAIIGLLLTWFGIIRLIEYGGYNKQKYGELHNNTLSFCQNNGKTCQHFSTKAKIVTIEIPMPKGGKRMSSRKVLVLSVMQ